MHFSSVFIEALFKAGYSGSFCHGFGGDDSKIGRSSSASVNIKTPIQLRPTFKSFTESSKDRLSESARRDQNMGVAGICRLHISVFYNLLK